MLPPRKLAAPSSAYVPCRGLYLVARCKKQGHAHQLASAAFGDGLRHARMLQAGRT
jgi:hypothetical protein